MRRPMTRFDIAPFALPNCAPGEVRFEEPRGITEVEVEFKGKVPSGAGISYLRKTWPRIRLEEQKDRDQPGIFGWNPIDDQFNSKWTKAAVLVRKAGSRASFTFRKLTVEKLEDAPSGYAPTYRRTLGVRVDAPDPAVIATIRAFSTVDEVEVSRLRVELDRGSRTPGVAIRLSAYNASVQRIRRVSGVRVEGHTVLLGRGRRVFEVDVRHVRLPVSRYCGDLPLLTLTLGRDAFTVGLQDLTIEDGIWYAEQGVFVFNTEFGFYHRSSARTVLAEIGSRPEHTLTAARNGQPRPHPVSYNLACKHARQRFWLEPNGDLILHKWNLGAPQRHDAVPPELRGVDTGRFLAKGNARILFGLEGKPCTGRFPDPPPVPVYNMAWRAGGISIEQKSLCVPLMRSILRGDPAGDETTAALVRFRFRNEGLVPEDAVLDIAYSQDANRTGGWYGALTVPPCPRDRLSVRGRRVESVFAGRKVLRMTVEGPMRLAADHGRVRLSRHLRPGETCEVLLKIPYLAPNRGQELRALDRLDFDRCHREVTAFWRRECATGSQLECPESQFQDLYRSHLMHVQVTDFAMPGHPELVNTSVGTSTYGNYSNESCMIVHELDERGLHAEARRRLAVWLKYQGTVPQPGNFTDYEGMFFGAGGFEMGDYNQHHGWVLWCMAEHYRLTRDRGWLNGVAGPLVRGAEWVFQQRRNTVRQLPHSRGWERGFLPAGSLEDVTDFQYWLSTNAVTWRGCDAVAGALEDIGHPEAGRVRREADAYGDDLRRGFDNMRRHAPLVRLGDGRWIPSFPSRLYLRGRDVGWIRETLEGSVYLLISGLYGLKSREAGWILDDYLDNRYHTPPYGYQLVDPETNLRSRGGFSIQPNLLAGLMPHLDRDEPEIYIWMFLNAWTACYRSEINAMVEHPLPDLGFSNAAHFKTSDEANAVSWLRYMYVYATPDLVHLGRAMPRAWLRDSCRPALTRAATRFGAVSVRYDSRAARGEIRLAADLALERAPARILARFRHPDGKPLKAVRVNGRPWRRFDRGKCDVDLTGLRGRVAVAAFF